MSIVRSLGLAFETLLTNLQLSAENIEQEHVIANDFTFEDIATCNVMMDAEWSKQRHRHSCDSNSGIGVTFDAHAHQETAVH